MEAEKKSSATAKTALGLSIGALGVELLNGSFGNFLGNRASTATASTVANAAESGMIAAMLSDCCNRNTAKAEELSDLKAQIASLQAEKYTDLAIQAQRDREASLNEKVIGYVIDLDKKIAANTQEIACLERQITLENKLYDQKVECLANTTNAGISAANSAINNLAATVSSFTKTVIPSTSVCNTNSNPSCCSGTCQ